MKRNRIPSITRGDNEEVLQLIKRLDLSRLPFKTHIEAGWVKDGPNEGLFRVYIRARVRDSHKPRKKIWIGVEETCFVSPFRDRVSGRKILSLVRQNIHRLYTHEIDESILFDDSLAWDPHSVLGRERAKASF